MAMTARWWVVMPMLALASTTSMACGDDDAAQDGDEDAGHEEGDHGHDAANTSCNPRPASALPPAMGCGPRQDDYAPCSDDGYPACVSDDGEYHRIQESISTIARVAAFEEIAELLFDPARDLAAADFLSARKLYQEDEGLDSRVVRRYDPYFEVPDGTDCTAEGVPEMYPDYCVGPAKLQPILLDAFDRGALDDAPREQAARIEGALLWFLFSSTNKESLSCTTAIADCDSAYAYYTGGEAARGGLGLGRYVEAVDRYAHDRIWDGLLAVRCWRDLDDGATAQDFELRDRARAQVFSALVDGLAAVVRDRLEQLAASSGDEQRYHFAFVTTLGPALVPETTARSKAQGDALAAELAKTEPADVDTEAATDALDAVYECP
jgi:hypothetical protein